MIKLTVSLHPFYQFKWKVIFYSGLLVLIIRNISKVMGLDQEISLLINETNILGQELNSKSKALSELLDKGLSEKEKKVKKEYKRRIKALHRELNSLKSKIAAKINKLCKDVRKDLSSLETISSIDNTLLYKKSSAIVHLAHVIEKEKRLTIEQKRSLLSSLKSESKKLKENASHLEKEAKNLARAGSGVGITTVLLAEISPKTSIYLEKLIKRKAIEIAVIRKKMKGASFRELLELSHAHLTDIYLIGTYKDVLIRRMRRIFENCMARFLHLNLGTNVKRDFDSTRKFLEKIIHNVERLGIRLHIEISQKENEIDGILRKFEETEPEKAKKMKEEYDNYKKMQQELKNRIAADNRLKKLYEQEKAKTGELPKVV